MKIYDKLVHLGQEVTLENRFLREIHRRIRGGNWASDEYADFFRKRGVAIALKKTFLRWCRSHSLSLRCRNMVSQFQWTFHEGVVMVHFDTLHCEGIVNEQGKCEIICSMKSYVVCKLSLHLTLLNLKYGKIIVKLHVDILLGKSEEFG